MTGKRMPRIKETQLDSMAEVIQQHINWAAEWDDALPADTFFDIWAEFQKEKNTIALKARIIEGNLELTAPPQSSIKVEKNHILLDSGQELGIQLETT